MDQLPTDFLDALDRTLVADLHQVALAGAVGSAVDPLLHEVRLIDGPLAERLRAPLVELTSSARSGASSTGAAAARPTTYDRRMARRRGWPIPGAELLAAAVVVVVLLSGCADDQPITRTSETGVGVDVTVGLTRFEPAVRKTAPVAAGPSLDGTATVSTADHLGAVVVLNVWESGCGPCRAEAPDLLRASHATRATAVFIGLNARDRQTGAAQAFIRSQDIDYPQISDPSGQQLLNFAGTLPLSSIPTTVVIDTEGRIAARIIGTVGATTLTQLITDIDAGR